MALRMLVVLFLLSVVCFGEEKVTFEGYQVIRLHGVYNQSQYLDIYDTTEKYHYDIWAKNSIEGWVDVMIPPNTLGKVFQEYKQELRFADVQQHFDESESENVNSTLAWNFGSFPTYQEVTEWIATTIQTYSTVASRVVVGKTFDNNDIVGVRLTKGSTAKKVIVLQCTIHAREWITTTTCLYVIDQLLKVDQTLIERFEWNIVPVLNVDGYLYTRTNRNWRKSRNTNPSSSCIGTDLNRNWPYQWGGSGASSDPCSDTFRGQAAGGAPETKAMVTFLANLNAASRLQAFVDIHAYGAMWMCPWAYTTAYPEAYNDMMANMRKSVDAIRALPRRSVYSAGTVARIIYICSGDCADYVYGTLKQMYAFGIEVTGSSFSPPVADIIPVGGDVYAGVKAMAQAFV